MTTPQAPAGDTPAAVPVACSLGTARLAERAARWERLAAAAMTGYAKTPDGLRLSFRPAPGAEDELRALAALETRCCSWAAWTVRAAAPGLVLEIRSTGAGVAALHGMFAGLRQAPASRAPASRAPASRRAPVSRQARGPAASAPGDTRR